MNEKFKKIKNKFLFAAIIKSVIVGFSAALFVIGVLLLSFTLSKVAFHWGWYFLIGFVLIFAAGGVTFLILRPTDKAVAKRLDAQFNLNERVQTMVEYSGKEGDMITVQRADAVEKLSALPAGKFTLKDFLKFISVAVLSFAIFISGTVTCAILNGKQDNGHNDLPSGDFTLSEFQILSVTELLENIEKSDLKKEIKDADTTIVQSLLDNLRNVTKQDAMRVAVTSSIGMIDVSFENATSFYKVGTALLAAETTNAFTVALRESSRAYLTGVDLSEFINVQQVAENIEDAVRTMAETRFNNMAEQINTQSGEAFFERIVKLSTDLTAAVTTVETDENDVLTALFKDLSLSLKQISENGDEAAAKAAVSEKFVSFAEEYSLIMTEQTYCRMMNEYIRGKLSETFGVSVGALPVLKLNNSSGDGSGEDDGDGDNDEDKNNSGGFGDGDKLYGSNDVIYDPYTETYVKYADVLNEYYARVTEQIRNGEISEELQIYVNEYFKLLYSGIKDGEEGDGKDKA